MKFIKSLFFFVTIFTFLVSAGFSQAATITPNIFTDPAIGADPNNCSLRYAIESINDGNNFEGDCQNHSTGTLGTNDTVVLDVGTYLLTLSGIDDNNQTGDLDVQATDITIIGAGSDQTTIDASGIMGGDRIISFIMVQNATVIGVRMTGGDVAGLTQVGGAIFAITLNLNLDDVHLIENQADQGGGLATICSPTINNSIIERNQALANQQIFPQGGGIFLMVFPCPGNPFMTINNSWIIDNLSEGVGGGIALEDIIFDAGVTSMLMNNSTVDGNMADDEGGGIYSGLLSRLGITYSTISRNTSVQEEGGGIKSDAEFFFLTNSTVSNNESLNDGGGINSGSGLKGMYNVTVAFNRATGPSSAAGGISFNDQAQPQPPFDLQVFNTIIAQNTAGDPNREPDCQGTFFTGGYNLIGIVTGNSCFGFSPNVMGDKVGSAASPIDPELLPLDFYGGTTETHALAMTSPAVDMGNDVEGCRSLDIPMFFQDDFDENLATFFELSDDQRFFTRPIAIRDPNLPICDIGAFELQTFTFEVTKDDGLGGATIEVDDGFTYTIVLTNNGPGDAGNVMLSDPLPSQVTFNSVNTSQGSCSQAGGVVSCDLGDIPQGGVVTVTIEVTANAEGDALNTVTVFTSVGDFEASVLTVIKGVFIEGSGCHCDITRKGPVPFHGKTAVALFVLVGGLAFWWVRRHSDRGEIPLG